jgi:Spy/CpxP family protein refolding chaperone
MQRTFRADRMNVLGIMMVSCVLFSFMALGQEAPPAAGQQNTMPDRCPMCGQTMSGQSGAGPAMQHRPGMMMGMPGHGMMQQAPDAGPQPGMGQGMGMGMGQGMGMGPGMGMRMRQPGPEMPAAGVRPGMRAVYRMPMRQPRPAPQGPRFDAGDGISGLLRRPEVQKELGITAEQRQKLQDIGFESSKSAIQGRAALEVLNLELNRILGAENPDRGAIDKKLQEVAQAETILKRSQINARLDAQNVLTKEQRGRIPQVMEQLRPQPQGGFMPAKPALPVPMAPAPKEKPKPAPTGN